MTFVTGLLDRSKVNTIVLKGQSCHSYNSLAAVWTYFSSCLETNSLECIFRNKIDRCEEILEKGNIGIAKTLKIVRVDIRCEESMSHIRAYRRQLAGNFLNAFEKVNGDELNPRVLPIVLQWTSGRDHNFGPTMDWISFLTSASSNEKRNLRYSPLGFGSPNQVFDQSISTYPICASHEGNFCFWVTHDQEYSKKLQKVVGKICSFIWNQQKELVNPGETLEASGNQRDDKYYLSRLEKEIDTIRRRFRKFRGHPANLSSRK